MSTILVVDDMAIFRDPIAASLRLHGHETFCAADGEEALALARLNHPDVILLDVSMPKMDGLTFLKHMRGDASIAKTNVIVLTALSEKKHVIAAASLGVKDYLLKSRFRLVDLLERVEKADAAAKPAAPLKSPPAAAATTPAVPPAKATIAVKSTPGIALGAGEGEVPRLVTREQFLERVERVFQAKSLSGVVAQVIATANSPRGDRAQLANLIAQDPMLSVRVLQAANSASYASAGAAVNNIPDALRKLGFATVRNIAAALGVFDCMPASGTDGFDPIRCWQHSFAVAQLSERLAMAGLPDQAGLAYVAGLCHDLGDIFIRSQFNEEHKQFVEFAERTGRPKEQLYGLMLGMTRSRMISEVLRCMALPVAIREPIESLHSPARLKGDDALARILWAAENIANAAMLASAASSEVAPLTAAFCRKTFGDGGLPMPDPLALRSQVMSLTATLARLSREDEAKLLMPLIKSSPTNVWLARHGGISDVDPIGLALGSIAQPVIHDRLPAGPELDACDALVIVSPSTELAGFASRDVEALLARDRGARPPLPTLAIAATDARVEAPQGSVRWRSAVALAELARFVEPDAADAGPRDDG